MLFAAAGEGNSVLASLKGHPDLAPEQIVPIGSDSFGSLFVLDAKGGFSVYVIDYKQPVRAIEVAPSFAEPMARIQVTPYDY